ncbi:MAG: glycine cleavage system protein GcvH [Chlamydiia bacterium]|nr:glycine cleavage system protein GcvH [Chlamydiia bacterium]
MKYTESHEWVDVQGNIATIGVTHHAQKELGDIVFVELPNVGSSVKAGAEVAVLESTKAAADVYTPISGMITEVNSDLNDRPELINADPEKEGWIYKIEIEDIREMEKLLSPGEYELLTK